MSAILTAAELSDLTGYKTAAGHRKWLDRRHWKYETDRLGRPKVDREYYRGKMGIKNGRADDLTTEPNWGALA